MLETEDVILDGYWQTEKYFADIRPVLLEEFCFPSPVSDMEENLLQEIRACESVSIHIRRGDYLNHRSKYGNICTEEYYKKAIRCIREKIHSSDFYVFSDDMEWSRKFLQAYDNMHFVELPSGSGIHDMKLMSACRHNIIANSSFSWWASWLNQNPAKTIIAPARWQNTGECPDTRCGNWSSPEN